MDIVSSIRSTTRSRLVETTLFKIVRGNFFERIAIIIGGRATFLKVGRQILHPTFISKVFEIFEFEVEHILAALNPIIVYFRQGNEFYPTCGAF